MAALSLMVVPGDGDRQIGGREESQPPKALPGLPVVPEPTEPMALLSSMRLAPGVSPAIVRLPESAYMPPPPRRSAIDADGLVADHGGVGQGKGFRC